MAFRSKVRWRTHPWFRVLRYGFCPDEAAWEYERDRALKRAHVEIGPYPASLKYPGMTTSFINDGGARCHLVTLADDLDDDPIRLVSTIAHESVHVAEAIIEAMADANPSEEFRAYAVGAITGEIFEDYSRVRSPAAKAAS